MRTFFPLSIQTELDEIINNMKYSQSHIIKHITINEIRKIISQAPPKKASEEDIIPNLILKKTLKLLLPHLHRIFNVYITNEYYSDHFRISVTVILLKSDKNHSILKDYRSIALLNTIEKIMKFILVRRITYLAKTHNLLSSTHMGGRRLRSCEHDIYYLLERIYQA